MLLVMGGLAEKLQRFTRHKWTRYIAGILLIAFGVMILTKALSGGHMGSGHQQGMQHDMPQNMQQDEMQHEVMQEATL